MVKSENSFRNLLKFTLMNNVNKKSLQTSGMLILQSKLGYQKKYCF